MRVLSSSFATTASRLEGSFRLTTTGNAAAQTISALGGLAFNNLGTVDIDGTGTIYVKTTTTDVSGLRTRLTISGSGNVGIGTSSPLSNLHVYKGLSGASLLGLEDGITLTLENDTTNYINFRSPNTVYAGLAFTTPADNSAGYIALRQSTGDMIFSNEKSTGYHTFLTSNTERLRIANTETTVRNNLIVTGSVRVSGSTEFIGNQIVTGSLFTSGSNTLLGNTTLTGSFSVSGSTLQTGNNTLIGNTVLSGSIGISGSSTIQGTTTMSGSLNISGSTTQAGNNTLIGTTTLTGSILINGNITPQISSSFDLGSETNPWRAIYVQSGSISIQSDILGGIPAIISNANGNVTFAGAGFQL
jgi:hypothetical protein